MWIGSYSFSCWHITFYIARWQTTAQGSYTALAQAGSCWASVRFVNGCSCCRSSSADQPFPVQYTVFNKPIAMAHITHSPAWLHFQLPMCTPHPDSSLPCHPHPTHHRLLHHPPTLSYLKLDHFARTSPATPTLHTTQPHPTPCSTQSYAPTPEPQPLLCPTQSLAPPNSMAQHCSTKLYPLKP